MSILLKKHLAKILILHISLRIPLRTLKCKNYYNFKRQEKILQSDIEVSTQRNLWELSHFLGTCRMV